MAAASNTLRAALAAPLRRRFGVPALAGALALAGLLVLAPATRCRAQEPQPDTKQTDTKQPDTKQVGTKQADVKTAAPAHTPEQLETMATLDKLLAERNYEQLSKTVAALSDGPGITAGLDWGRARTLEGASLVVPLLYAALLWRTAAQNPQYAEMRQTSGLMASYAVLVMAADSPKCADKSAPEHQIASIIPVYKPLLASVAQLPEAQRKKIMDIAISLEQRLAPKRGNDAYLCRFGMQEHIDMTKKYGDKAYEEVPAKPGQLGRQMQLRSDPSYMPKFRPREQWEPEQAAARAHFQELLSTILTPQAGQAPSGAAKP